MEARFPPAQPVENVLFPLKSQKISKKHFIYYQRVKRFSEKNFFKPLDENKTYAIVRNPSNSPADKRTTPDTGNEVETQKAKSPTAAGDPNGRPGKTISVL